MFTLFHLIFTLFKIFVQAAVYATVILLAFRLVANGQPNIDWSRLSKNKSKFWLRSALIISLVLFIISFTPWGDHGLGDSSLIPVGHGKTIYNGDGSWTYFYTPDHNQRHIYKYEVKDDKLFAEQDDERYLTFDLKSSELKEFDDKESYEEHAKQNDYPLPNEFKDFIEHYNDYWNGWRFWFLP
jgi:hypothetical protein